jgi:hypothetical protein
LIVNICSKETEFCNEIRHVLPLWLCFDDFLVLDEATKFASDSNSRPLIRLEIVVLMINTSHGMNSLAEIWVASGGKLPIDSLKVSGF